MYVLYLVRAAARFRVNVLFLRCDDPSGTHPSAYELRCCPRTPSTSSPIVKLESYTCLATHLSSSRFLSTHGAPVFFNSR